MKYPPIVELDGRLWEIKPVSIGIDYYDALLRMSGAVEQEVRLDAILIALPPMEDSFGWLKCYEGND